MAQSLVGEPVHELESRPARSREPHDEAIWAKVCALAAALGVDANAYFRERPAAGA